MKLWEEFKSMGWADKFWIIVFLIVIVISLASLLVIALDALVKGGIS